MYFQRKPLSELFKEKKKLEDQKNAILSTGKIAISDEDFTKKEQGILEDHDQTERILVAQKSVHKGAMHGYAENGLELLDLGNGYGLNIVRDSSDYLTVQIFHYALNKQPRNQTYTRKQRVVVNAEPRVRNKSEPKGVIEVKKESEKKDLFSFDDK